MIKVSTAEEAALTGAPTFTVAFELDTTSRRQLTTLLTAARAANITIKPPPPRQARRYPVEWPVCLGTMRGAVRGDRARRLARRHVRAPDQRARARHQPDVLGGARRRRRVRSPGARGSCAKSTRPRRATAGSLPGYGLQHRRHGRTDRLRWHDFLVRVEKRAEKRVLIGASPARLAELQAGLAAAGYAVSGGTDPGALVQLASAERGPSTRALIDAGWLSPATSATWIESLFSARNVPCVTMRGDAREARATIDKLLARDVMSHLVRHARPFTTWLSSTAEPWSDQLTHRLQVGLAARALAPDLRRLPARHSPRNRGSP